MTNTRLTWAVGILAVLLVALGAWNMTLADRLASSERAGSDLQARLVQTTTDLTAAAQKQGDLEASVAGLEIPDISGVQQGIEGVSAKLADVEQRLAALPYEQLTAKVGQLEAQLAALTMPSLVPLEEASTQARADIDQLRQDLVAAEAEQASQLDALVAQVDALASPDEATPADALTRIQGRVDALAASIASAPAADPTALVGRIDAIEQRIATLQMPDQTALEAELRKVAADVASSQPLVAAAATKTELASVTAEIEHVSGRASDTEAKVAALGSELSDQIAALGETLATKENGADIADIEVKLAALGAEVTRLGTEGAASAASEVGTMRSELQAIAQRVDRLPSGEEIASLRSDVSQVASARAAAAPRLLELISFGASQSQVSDEERAKIAALAQSLAGSPVTLEIVGFADSTGPAEFNRGLSLRRAAAVRSALIAAGVDPAAVTSVTGLGEDGPPVDAGDDADEAQNRVVMIYQRS